MTDETTDERMGAASRALCERGYALLRILDRADESTGSTAALNPGAVAESVVTVLDGAFTRHLAVDHPIEHTREILLGDAQQHAFADGVAPEVVSE